jgi:hypothetical protein
MPHHILLNKSTNPRARTGNIPMLTCTAQKNAEKLGGKQKI